MKHLFLFTIGPVQSFIAQARKTQDLAAGSKLLSDLVWKAIMWLAGKKINQNVYIKAENIIFPYIETLEKKPFTNLPNRFLTIINEKDTGKIQEIGNKLKTRLEKEFSENAVKEIIVDKLGIQKGTPFADTIEKQLKNVLNIYWVAVPISGKPEEYKERYTRLEKLLAGIKNTRVFNQMPEKGRKCSVDGVNNVVIYRKHPEKVNPSWLNLDKINSQSFIINDNTCPSIKLKHISFGEGLSAVSFYKRIYKDPTEWKRNRAFSTKELDRFPSTAEIATWDTIDRLGEEFYDKIKVLFDTDEQFLFDENLTNEQLSNNPKEKEKIIEAQRTISGAITTKKLKLSPYYAILLFDADNMGKMLSGEFLSESKRTLEFQRKLSEKLIDFARHAKQYVDGSNERNSRGCTIYSGGDDFMGFLNLNFLFETLKELNDKFKIKVYNKIKDFLKPGTPEFTFSAGIVIAHYKTPLHTVLEQVRKSEKLAKNKKQGDRDAFCLTVMKKSGEINQTFAKWYSPDGSFIPDNILWITRKIQESQLSPSFIRHLAQEFKPLMDKEGEIVYDAGGSIKNILEQEFERLIGKSCLDEGLNKEAVSTACNLLNAFDDQNKRRIRFADLVQTLYIAEFIEREINPPVKAENTVKE